MSRGRAPTLSERKVIFAIPWPDAQPYSGGWSGDIVNVLDYCTHTHGKYTMVYVLTNDGYAGGIMKCRIGYEGRELEAIKPIFGLDPMEYLTLLLPGKLNNVKYLIRGQTDEGRLVSPTTLNTVSYIDSSRHFRSMVEKIFIFSYIFSCGVEAHRVIVLGDRPMMTSGVSLKVDRAKQVSPATYRDWLNNQPMSTLVARYYGGSDPLKIGSRIKYWTDRLVEALQAINVRDSRIQLYSRALQEALTVGVVVDNTSLLDSELEDKFKAPVLITR